MIRDPELDRWRGFQSFVDSAQIVERDMQRDGGKVVVIAWP